MASNDKTVYEGDETVYEDDTVFDGDATVFDGDETVLEDDNATAYEDDDATVYETEDDAAVDKPLSNEEIVKGGSILDTYTVESNPIHGGMGSVWKVHHKNWNADLAMKRPQPHCFATQKSKERFIEECKTWIDLGLHPNIVSCYYVRDIGGTPTIFSEWMEYGSLENRIEDESLYAGSEKEQQMRILDIAIQFARGLHYAHEQGHIHQDVKPDNLLLTKAWDAKVADFGLAKARAMLTYLEMDDVAMDGSKTIITPSGGRSPHYCSMEQLDGKPLTRKTDIYSWAVSVLEMYLGYKPWANGAFDSGPIAGLNCREYFTMTRLPMPEAMKDLLVRCLAAEPAERPHDFNMVEDELKAVYLTVAGKAYPRPEPKAAPDSPDALHNRALSLIDLGRKRDAVRCWQKALEIDPNHTYSALFMNLYLWRKNQRNALQLKQALAQARSHSVMDDDLRSLFESAEREGEGDREDEELERTELRLIPMIPYSDVQTYEQAIAQAKAAIAAQNWSAAAEALEQAWATQTGKNSRERSELNQQLEGHLERKAVRQILYLPGYEEIAAKGFSNFALDEHAQRLLIGGVYVYDLAVKTCLIDRSAHTSGGKHAFLSPDGKTAIYGDYSDSWWISPVDAWQKEKVFSISRSKRHEQGMQNVFSRDRSYAAMIGFETYGPKRSDYVWLWDVKHARLKRSLKRPFETLQSVDVNGDGSLLAVGSKGGGCVLVNLLKRKQLSRFGQNPPHEYAKNCVAVSPDGKWAAQWFDRGKTLYVYEMTSPDARLVHELEIPSIQWVSFSNDSQFLFTDARRFHVVHAPTGEVRSFSASVPQNAISGDGNSFINSNGLWRIEWQYAPNTNNREQTMKTGLFSGLFGKKK